VEVKSIDKVTAKFMHCGMGYSPTRRGMVVVKNNAINNSAIKVEQPLSLKLESTTSHSAYGSDFQKQQSDGQRMAYRNLILQEALAMPKADKVNKNKSAIRTV
jgi:hypothetical protein